MSSKNRNDRQRDPRRVALGLLQAVLRRRQTLDSALVETKAVARLEPRDRAFVRSLVATTLRRLGQIDAQIAYCLNRPLKPKLAEVQDLLRLGTSQLLFLDIPTHAAISSTIALATTPRLVGHRPLLNAVLHRLAREGHQLIATQDAPRLNTPDWLWQSWCSDFGEPMARAIAAAHLCEPPLDLTVKADPQAWASRMGGMALPWGSVRLPPGSGEVSRLPGYRDGDWWVQDSAAALPVRLLGDLRGRRALDLCAAPGGKTAQLSQAGAAVAAVDRSKERMQQLRDNMDRLRLEVESTVADVTAWRPHERADAVLLDAPCSGTGTLRRRPDIAYLRSPGDIETLQALQRRLLAAAVEMLRPGGLLVYSVCSLQREEGSEQIATLLETVGHDLERLHVTPQDVGGQTDFINFEGDLQTLPSHFSLVGGLDGFYACRLRKR